MTTAAPPHHRPLPAAALDLIRRYEGLRLRAYRCPAGIWTIGYGHTGQVDGRPLTAGVRITEAQADAYLLADALGHARDILAAATVPLTDGEYGALVALGYNIGWPALRRSTLWRRLMAGDRAAAAAEFARWTRASGRVLPGLVRRRAAERALFLTPGHLPS